MPSLTPVASSNIKALGYDADTKTLSVQFHNGRVYSYTGVPQGEYDNLLNAGSIGSYFANNIKNVYAIK